MPPLFPNLAMGSLLATLSVLVHTLGFITIGALMPILSRRLGLHGYGAGRTVLMMIMVLALLLVLTLEAWLWAGAYRVLRVAPTFEDCLSLSAAMFSTLGYGEIAFDPRWRLMTSLEGVSGFLLIGWSTAFLVQASTLHGPFRKHEHF